MPFSFYTKTFHNVQARPSTNGSCCSVRWGHQSGSDKKMFVRKLLKRLKIFSCALCMRSGVSAICRFLEWRVNTARTQKKRNQWPVRALGSGPTDHCPTGYYSKCIWLAFCKGHLGASETANRRPIKQIKQFPLSAHWACSNGCSNGVYLFSMVFWWGRAIVWSPLSSVACSKKFGSKLTAK